MKSVEADSAFIVDQVKPAINAIDWLFVVICLNVSDRNVLSEAQVDRLRTAAATARQRRRFIGPTCRIRFSGGPLDGAESVVSADNTRNQYMGWCVVHDRLGPITALYMRTNDPRLWQFEGLDIGVQ